jgi:hypothetical protein
MQGIARTFGKQRNKRSYMNNNAERSSQELCQSLLDALGCATCWSTVTYSIPATMIYPTVWLSWKDNGRLEYVYYPTSWALAPINMS